MVLSITEYTFFVFLGVCLLIYWSLRRWVKVQNGFLLGICYLFYSLNDFAFVFL
ncbi:MAG: hypothetical protein RBG13Loki_3315 [Promethearchaeota archaeon CR_4]|nr:MAG: hypothetical protein RBG13Loki_3315 [Candidatus Lokiarchaeota archaeon CR_4]